MSPDHLINISFTVLNYKPLDGYGAPKVHGVFANQSQDALATFLDY